MNKQEYKRKRIFETYSANLRMVSSLGFDIELERPIYICPLCKNKFTSDSLDTSVKNNLTIEHITPDSIGGTEIILTCKNCNNNDGSQFDKHLAKKHNEVLPFLKMDEHSKLSSSFKIGDSIKSNGHLCFDKKHTLILFFDPKRTSPKDHENIKQYLKQKKGEVKFEIKCHDPVKSNISILRSAFLIAFKKMGYGFLLSKNSDIPRKLIRNFQSGSTKFNAILKGRIPDNMLGVNIIMKPREINSYFVVVKIKNENYGVILPGSNIEGEKVYKEYEKLVAKGNLTISCRPIDNLDYINQEQYCLVPHYNWRRKKE